MARVTDDEPCVKAGPVKLIPPKAHIIKKYKKHYAALYAKSDSGIARLEVYENQNAKTYVLLISHNEVVSVRREQVDHQTPWGFVIATKDHQHHFIAGNQVDRDIWIQKIRSTLIGTNDDTKSSEEQSCCKKVIDNNEDLYESAGDIFREFRVEPGIETQKNLGLDSMARLVVDDGALTLITLEDNRIGRWNIAQLRKLSYSTSNFSFEAGRKSEHGEGWYSFITKQSEAIRIRIEREKEMLKQSKGITGTVTKLGPGHVTSATATEYDVPETTGGHIYEEFTPMALEAQGIERKLAKKQPPKKPERQKHISGGKHGSPPISPGAMMKPLGSSLASPHNSYKPIKSHPTHPSVRSKAESEPNMQPASIGLNNINTTCTSRFEYCEVGQITEAWKTHGKTDEEEARYYEKESEGHYDKLSFLSGMETDKDKDQIYANEMSLPRVHSGRPNPEAALQPKPIVEPIYAQVNKPKKNDKQQKEEKELRTDSHLTQVAKHTLFSFQKNNSKHP